AEGLLLWWFKPMYEPPLLYWMGRRLFDEQPDWREMRRRWLGIVWPQLIPNLTWRRFSPSRSFVMPVAVLERLRGKARGQRIRVLGRNGHAASWLTVVGIHFEMALEISLFVLLLYLVPEELLWTDWQSYLWNPDPLSEWIQQICALLAMSLVAPFYVAGGFALYLNRRSELEAWDIELGLRRMAQRHTQRKAGVAAALLALGLSLSALSPQPAHAVETASREAVQQAIEEVLAGDDFGRHEKRFGWRYIGEEQQGDSSFFKRIREFFKNFSQGISNIAEFLLWLAAGALLAYLIYWFLQNRGLLGAQGRSNGNGGRRLPTHIAGLDLRPESLPEDPATIAMRMIEAGDYREAFSLLYRGALSSLVHRHALQIVDGATEGECRALAAHQLEAGLSDCFSRLTGVWLALAYGHRPPEKPQALALCQQWRSCFGGADAE
ncbi:MAG: DUF4129 domain-containing protein, partial [Candidatus Thiodiazotropha sp.]